MAIKRMKIMADLETTTQPDDVRAWAVCAVDIDTAETVFLDTNLDKFMEWLSNKNTVCYFHNLKFDGEFLLSWLLNNGYKYDIDNRKDAKTFTTLITDDGIFYSITVIFEKKNKTYKKVVFYDSLKKLPFKVATISKAFELEDEKLEIDYKAYRSPDHQLTEEEKHYIVNDCKIVAQALKIQIDKGLNKMTNASDAMNGYKAIITPRQFERWFPVLPVELDADIRQAYKGGYVYLNKKHRNKRGLKGLTLDVNSLYPYIMYSCMLPYGYPMYFEGEPEPDENYPLFIVRLRCGFKLKKNHLPTIQLKNNRAFIETEYLESSNGDIVEMTLTSVDLALFLEHYDVYCLEYLNGWKFKGAVGMFKEYIEYWSHIKETTTGANRQLAKLMLNSLYGRFALNPRTRKKIAYLDENEVVKYRLDDPELRDPVYVAMGAFITSSARNLTIRSANKVYDRFIYADTDSLHLIGTELPEGLDIHPTRLGAWKNEGTFIDSKYIRAKTYMESMLTRKKSDLHTYCKLIQAGFYIQRDKKEIAIKDTLKNFCLMLNCDSSVVRVGGQLYGVDTKVTCAGMPDNVKELVTYENFKSGSTFDGKLMPRRYKGGIILQETTFTIK